LGGYSVRREGAARLACLLTLAAAFYGNALGNDLVWDDRLSAAAPASLLGRTGPYYRPVVFASFALERTLWGGAPFGAHLTNVLCHVGVAWLVGALVRSCGLGAGAALASALVFAAHPIQTEAVTYVSGRTDLLCALFALSGFLLWRRAARATDRFAVASAGAFLLALLSKEAALALPLALLVPGAHPAPRPPRPVLPLALTGVWLVAASLTGTGTHVSGVAVRLPAIAGAALTYLRLLVAPFDLHLERFVPVIGWSAMGAVAAWAGVAAALAGLAVLARRTPAGGFFLAIAILAYAPVAGVVPIYPAIAHRALFTPEHFLYLPLLGLVPLLVDAAATAWPPRTAHAAPILLAALLLGWGAIVVDRNRDWRDEATLFHHTLTYDPPSARVWFNTGNLALAAGDLTEAERLYSAALVREPHDAAAHLNLGITLQRQRRLEEAATHYRAALSANPNLPEARRALESLTRSSGAQ
jgi:hypothetical protein